MDVLSEVIGGATKVMQGLDDPAHGDQGQGGHADEQDREGDQQVHRPIE